MNDKRKPRRAGFGLGLGIAIGVAIGLAMDNVGAGIAIGVAIGAAIGSTGYLASKRGEAAPEASSTEDSEET